MTEVCSGNPEGHNWQLQDEWVEHFAIRSTRRSLFRKRIVECGDKITDWTLIVASTNKMWYCTHCRQFDTVTKVINTPEDFLAKGFSVGDELPKLTTKEAECLSD